VDEQKLTEFLRALSSANLGATMAAGNIVVGHRLGLYRALATGPATPEELAERVQADPRYLAEWLRGQAAGGYVTYDEDTGRFGMTEEQAFALADPAARCTSPGRLCWPWARCGPSRRSPRRSEPGRAWVGTSTTATCSPAPSCSSDPATWRT